MNLTPCSCGAQVPNDGGFDHPVIAAAAPCWWRFRQLEARADRDSRDRLNLINDAYCAQHADGLEKNAAHRQVVWFSLLMLAARPVADELRTRTEVVPPAHIDLPRDMGALTVFDIPLASPTKTFVSAIDAWAESVWNAWSNVHSALGGGREKVGL